MARRMPPNRATWEKLISHHAVGFSVLAVLACAGATFPAQGAAQGNASQPNFAPTSQVGWTALTSEFIMPPSGPGPVMDDPAHPYVSNAIPARTGKVPSFPVGDVSNPILQPCLREPLRNPNQLALPHNPP